MSMDGAIMGLLARLDRLERAADRNNGEVAGPWTAFTPTLTQGVAVGVTVNRARYRTLGKTAHLEVQLTVTGAGTAANPVIVSVPSSLAVAHVVGMLVGNFVLLDNGTQWYSAIPHANPGTSIYGFYTVGNNVLGSVGFTAALAANDVVYLATTYELA